MKNFRAVYEYKKDLIRGAGACFAIAEDEAHARVQIAKAMPGVTIMQIKEEPNDPRAAYERPVLRLVASVPSCELCEKLLVLPREVERGHCDDCQRAIGGVAALAPSAPVAQSEACGMCGDTRPPQDFPGFAVGTFMVCRKCGLPRVLR